MFTLSPIRKPLTNLDCTIVEWWLHGLINVFTSQLLSTHYVPITGLGRVYRNEIYLLTLTTLLQHIWAEEQKGSKYDLYIIWSEKTPPDE